jgi:hypothetical protein
MQKLEITALYFEADFEFPTLANIDPNLTPTFSKCAFHTSHFFIDHLFQLLLKGMR